VDRHDPLWPALQVAGVAVGGSFLSRLNRIIREERGYTYGIHLSTLPQRNHGTWTISSSIRTEVAVAALDETLHLLALDEALSESEVTDARAQILGIAPLASDTAEAVVGQASRLAATGSEPGQINRHREAVRRVDADAATRAARDVFIGSAAQVVMVGPADELTGPLEAAGHQVETLNL